jgi:proline racemase
MEIAKLITALDYHHGQASRTVISGYPPILGRDMREKSMFFEKKMSWLRKSLCREPRGHVNMLGTIITDPTGPNSTVGMLFFSAERQYDMCGDCLLCAVHALLESGMISKKERNTKFLVDTPAGPVRIKARIKNSTVERAAFENVPSFHYASTNLELNKRSPIKIEIAYGGLFFAFADARDLNLDLDPENSSMIIKSALEIKAALNASITIKHPEQSAPSEIALVTFYNREKKNPLTYRVANVYSPGIMGRTPSGTGTSAFMSVLENRGELDLEQPYIQESIIGTHFKGRLLSRLPVGEMNAFIPEISAKSYLMGIHHFVLNNDDPFREGFAL